MLYLHHSKPKFVVLVNLKCMSRSFQHLIKNNYPDAKPRWAWMYSEIRDELDLSDYYKLGVVRNPYSRVVSVFESKTKRNWKGDFHEIHNHLFEFYGVEESRKKQKFLFDLDFTKFCKFVRENFYKDLHLIPQFLLYTNGNFDLFFKNIKKLENIDEWRQKVENFFDAELPHINESSKNQQTYKEYYDEDTKRMIKHVYRQDLNLFNYKF